MEQENVVSTEVLFYRRFREAAPSFGFSHDVISSETEFEALFAILRQGPPLTVADTLRNLATVTNQVCEIRDAGVRIGTGFLVGPDLVMTAYHVVASRPLDRLDCRFNNISFDSKQVKTSQPTTTAVVADLARSALAVGQPVTTTAFDFNLLRVSDRVGNGTRGFVKVAPMDSDKDNSVYVIEHPGGDAVSFSGGTVVADFDNNTEAAFRHNARTAGGASGAPVFNNQFQVIGVHRGISPIGTDNEAIDISRIYRELHPEFL
jgi:V8-like Glu-specific endopeptidase